MCLKLASGSLKREDVFNEEPSLVPCRQKCGEVYCSVECEHDFWKCHSLLCTGPIKDENHPLLEWKRHAILNNEIFLLVGDVVSAILAFPELKGAYTDFTMVPWWTVATLPFVDNPMGFSEARALDSSCRSLCEESAYHLNQVLKLQGVETELITPLFIAQIIGAFEQNSIGIRARHPLCRDILEDIELRSHQLQEVVRCLEKAGFIGEGGCEDDACEDEACDNTSDGKGDNGSEMMTEDNNDDVDGGEQNKESQWNYTSDEIAGFLASLNIDEREGEDDLGAVFPPLDGTAMFSTTCKMNHSCDPNVVVVYRGLKWHEPLVAQCIAKCDIELGEELCISYVDVNEPVEVRQRELANYGFNCSCVRCCAELNGEFCNEAASHTSDEQMSVDDDDIVDEDDNDELEHAGRGEEALRERLDELKSTADLSPCASIPAHILLEAKSFVVQRGTAVLSSLDQSSEIANDLVNCLAAAKSNHFGACVNAGSKLETQLSKFLEQNGSWAGVVHQEVFWVAAVATSIGLAHGGGFLRAQTLLDKAAALGQEQYSIESFLSFVQRHANEMYRGALVAVSVECHGPELRSAVQGLSKPIRFEVSEFRGSLTVSSSLSEANPFALRGYASHWDAVSRWTSLSWFASRHGHRLLPIETISTSKPMMMTMRSFVSSVLAPSCTHPVWSLQDSSSRPNASVVMHHRLMHQIPELRQYVEVAPPLCGELGPSNINVWMRSGGSRMPLQCDSRKRLLVQIVGAIYLRLYAEGEGSKLCMQGVADVAEGNRTTVECELEDFEGHPRARDAVFEEALLFPGDGLFIPSNMWLYTRSLTTSVCVIYQW